MSKTPADTVTPRLRLHVTATAAEIIRGGHPWVFARSIAEQNRAGVTGELAVLFDRKDRFLAVGLYDPNSPLLVRVLHAGKPVMLDAPWWTRRLDTALERRQGLFDARTDGYRLICGESDGWPGLVLDRYGPVLVLKLYTTAWLPRLDEIIKLLRRSLEPERIVLRLSRNIQKQTLMDFQRADGEIVLGRPLETCPVFLESGLRFESDVARGQKTGFFLDQRENRRRVETLSAGRRVLNAFSFSGGFSVYAARGGAASVTDLDISAHALSAARRNLALNRSDTAVARCRHEILKADAFDWFETNTTPKFDLIILDPPSLARKESERGGAIRAYGKLAAAALKVLRPRGILVAASCSAHVTPTEFFEAVQHAAQTSGRRVVTLETTSHPPDHPATFPEAEYLKCIYLKG